MLEHGSPSSGAGLQDAVASSRKQPAMTAATAAADAAADIASAAAAE